jgi:hypothetical protein
MGPVIRSGLFTSGHMGNNSRIQHDPVTLVPGAASLTSRSSTL